MPTGHTAIIYRASNDAVFLGKVSSRAKGDFFNSIDPFYDPQTAASVAGLVTIERHEEERPQFVEEVPA
jgi:hypothetical protein